MGGFCLSWSKDGHEQRDKHCGWIKTVILIVVGGWFILVCGQSILSMFGTLLDDSAVHLEEVKPTMDDKKKAAQEYCPYSSGAVACVESRLPEIQSRAEEIMKERIARGSRRLSPRDPD